MRRKAVWTNRRNGERGAALVEVAITVPILLLISVGIFEFGRLYQTWQVVTNAAREGARIAVLPGANAANVQTRVKEYLQKGQLGRHASATVAVNPNSAVSLGAAGTASASLVTVTYPFDFAVLNPVARLVSPGTTLGGSTLNLTASAEMRNETAF